MKENYQIRDATPDEFKDIGTLMVAVYSQLRDFPTPQEQPKYYEKLANVGRLTANPKTRVLVAVPPGGEIAGGVVYIGDMEYYSSGGIATTQKDAAGFRLLAVDPKAQGNGLGRSLSEYCIDMAKAAGKEQVIIHSTEAMKVAWKMYEKIGFQRSKDLDFIQGDLPVFGFRLFL